MDYKGFYLMSNLETVRHSLAHVMAAAVKRLYPDVKFGIGPAIDDGFYYDFDFSEPLGEESLKETTSNRDIIIPAHRRAP